MIFVYQVYLNRLDKDQYQSDNKVGQFKHTGPRMPALVSRSESSVKFLKKLFLINLSRVLYLEMQSSLPEMARDDKLSIRDGKLSITLDNRIQSEQFHQGGNLCNDDNESNQNKIEICSKTHILNHQLW